MHISKERFFAEGSQLHFTRQQLEVFWERLEKEPASPSLIKYLYYFGAMIVIGSMSWFMTLGWAFFGGGGMLLIAAGYAVIFALLGSWLWNKEGMRVPGGLLITIAVCMVPLAVYGLQTYFHLWPEQGENYPDFYRYIDANWVLMEVATILAGALALAFFPFPFLTAPIAFAAWFLSMDIAPLFFKQNLEIVQRGWVSIFFGIAMLAIAYFLDLKKKGGYAFWSYLFGTLSFWGGLSAVFWDKGEGMLVIYLILNLLMMGVGVLLRRNVLVIFGAIGTFAYLSHLAYDIFKDSILFPFTLTGIGLAVILLGILYQKNVVRIETFLLNKLPGGIRKWIP